VLETAGPDGLPVDTLLALLRPTTLAERLRVSFVIASLALVRSDGAGGPARVCLRAAAGGAEATARPAAARVSGAVSARNAQLLHEAMVGGGAQLSGAADDAPPPPPPAEAAPPPPPRPIDDATVDAELARAGGGLGSAELIALFKPQTKVRATRRSARARSRRARAALRHGVRRGLPRVPPRFAPPGSRHSHAVAPIVCVCVCVRRARALSRAPSRAPSRSLSLSARARVERRRSAPHFQIRSLRSQR
jgi:hypothetical protein